MNSKTLNGNAVTPAYDANHPHAVSGYGSNSYTYDANGNMQSRTVNGQTVNLGYDAENRLANASGAATAQYTYDGDGKLVKAVDNAGTTVSIGGYFEDFYPSGGGETCRNYIFANGQRIAEREYSGSVTIGTYFLLNDHLRSLSITVNSDGSLKGELRYSAYGEERLSSGTTSTDYRYTGQLSKMAGIGLYFYQSRWMDPVTGHFAQPDTILPDPYNPQDWDRYAYSRNNPINYNDPSGHMPTDGCDYEGCTGDPNKIVITMLSPDHGVNRTLTPTEKPTPISDFIKLLPFSSRDWATFGKTADVFSLFSDFYADGVVIYATTVGFSITLPVIISGNVEVPALSGGADFFVADFYLVQPVLQLGNGIAGLATLSTYISETKSGATVIETGQFSPAIKNSATLFDAGLISREAIGSTLIQATSVLNDFGVISAPYH